METANSTLQPTPIVKAPVDPRVGEDRLPWTEVAPPRAVRPRSPEGLASGLSWGRIMDCGVAALTLLAAMSIVVHAHGGSGSGPRGSMVMELDRSDR